MNEEWLDQHQAAEVSGYNARSLRNMANKGKLEGQKRQVDRGPYGKIQAWHFRRSDMERLKAVREGSSVDQLVAEQEAPVNAHSLLG